MSERTRGLGKGLSALLGEADPDTARPRAARGGSEDSGRGPQAIPIELIRPNPDQPRRFFAPEEIDALAESIRGKGVLQPILVRPVDGDSYEIVAGERRWRASQKAGLHEIPALIRVLNDEETLEIAVVENVQRQDLTALEEAEAYRTLHDDFGRTQTQIADMIGKSRPHVANTMRLLELPQAVRTLLANGDITAGHARALIGAPNAAALAEEIVRRGLSVRQAEALVKKGSAPEAQGGSGGGASSPKQKDPDTAALESDLEAQLGLEVSLHDSGGGKGELRLRYETLEQLDDLCRRLTGG